MIHMTCKNCKTQNPPGAKEIRHFCSVCGARDWHLHGGVTGAYGPPGPPQSILATGYTFNVPDEFNKWGGFGSCGAVWLPEFGAPPFGPAVRPGIDRLIIKTMDAQAVELKILRARMDRRALFDLIDAERERQERLYPGRTIAAPNLPHFQRLAILTEEVGEVAKAINDRHDGKLTSGQENAKLREELTQVAACAVAWLEAIRDQGKVNTDASSDDG